MYTYSWSKNVHGPCVVCRGEKRLGDQKLRFGPFSICWLETIGLIDYKNLSPKISNSITFCNLEVTSEMQPNSKRIYRALLLLWLHERLQNEKQGYTMKVAVQG